LTTIKFQQRWTHGIKREQLFREYVNQRKDWNSEVSGKILLSQQEQDELNSQFISFDSKLSAHLLGRLPKSWQDIYLESLHARGTKGIPIKERFEADAKCFYKNDLIFDAEIKSDMTNWPNITYCLSGYIWALESRSENEIEKIYIWDIGDDVSKWRYLFLDQIVNFTLDVRTGIGLKGSQTPHGRVPKAKLEASNQYLGDLLSYFETVEF